MSLFFQWINQCAIHPSPTHDVVLWLYKRLKENTDAFDAMTPLPWKKLGDPYYTMLMAEEDEVDLFANTTGVSLITNMSSCHSLPNKKKGLYHLQDNAIRNVVVPLESMRPDEDYLTSPNILMNHIVDLLNDYMEDPYAWRAVFVLMRLYFQWVNQAEIPSWEMRHDHLILFLYKRFIQNVDAYDADKPLPWKTVAKPFDEMIIEMVGTSSTYN
jgi:hypothetical protein